MSVLNQSLTPSSSLPRIGSLLRGETTEEQITNALRNLRHIYCPLRLPVAIPRSCRVPNTSAASVAPVDSGYVSEDEEQQDDIEEFNDVEDVLATLRSDTFEREFAVRWLTSLIGCVEEVHCCEERRSQILDDAAFILSSFSDSRHEDSEESLTRDFSFPTSLGCSEIEVQLNDAPLTGADHTDVGLQSWGASIIMSSQLCKYPDRFGLASLPSRSTIVELGAGTGLVGLTIAKLLEHMTPNWGATVVATDYHAAVLENCRLNIGTNFPGLETPPVQTMLLDWSAPVLDGPLNKPVQMLVAADVVYAPEHAAWLRDCASRLVASDGVFWLIVTVRQHGKFEGIADTVEAAFATSEGRIRRKDGRILRVLERERIAKERGIGRGDETGYVLYRIGWA